MIDFVLMMQMLSSVSVYDVINNIHTSSDPWGKHFLPQVNISYDQDLMINTKYGEIYGIYAPVEYQGIVSRESPRAFLGIPFTSPIKRKDRFRYAKKWNTSFSEYYGRSTITANEFGPQCIQYLPFPIKNLNEDCLYLNVYLPPSHKQLKNTPVLIYFFGGAWVFGNGGVGTLNDTNLYVGSSLVNNENIIVITFNARVGTFGYLNSNHTDLNVGLDDLFKAMDWIVENIEAFGGDVMNLNIAGMSSGAFNAFLTAFRNVPKQTGFKIRRVILMSPPLSLNLREESSAYEDFRIFSNQLGCSEHDMECLLSKNPAQIIISELNVFLKTKKDFFNSPLPWLPRSFEEVSADGSINLISDFKNINISVLKDVEFIIGVSEHEAAFFFGLLEIVSGGSIFVLQSSKNPFIILRDWLLALWDDFRNGKKIKGIQYSILNAADRLYVDSVCHILGGKVCAKVFELYPPQKSLKKNVANWIDIFSDKMFICPNRELALQLSSRNFTVYMYQQHQSPENIWPFNSRGHMRDFPGAHGVDLMYLFDFWPSMTSNDKPMAKYYQKYFSNFIKGDINQERETGKPEQLVMGLEKDLPFWGRFTNSTRYVMNFGKDERNEAKVLSGLHEERCNFWNSLRPE